MKIDVLYFGRLKDALGREREELELDRGATVSVLLDALRTRAEWRELRALPLGVAVNDETAMESHELADGDRVALLPPVSGG